MQKFFEEAFPSISPSLRARFRSFLSTEALDHKWMYEASPRKDISQGDIFTEIPGFYFNGNDIKRSAPVPFIALTHTCDMAIDKEIIRNKNYIYAPLFPCEVIEKYLNADAIKKNIITHKMCFHTVPSLGSSFVADLNMIGSFDSKLFH